MSMSSILIYFSVQGNVKNANHALAVSIPARMPQIPQLT